MSQSYVVVDIISSGLIGRIYIRDTFDDAVDVAIEHIREVYPSCKVSNHNIKVEFERSSYYINPNLKINMFIGCAEKD